MNRARVQSVKRLRRVSGVGLFRVVRPLALLVSLGVAPLCFGQTKEAAVCGRSDFQAAGYTVRSSRVENPFAFLPWVRAARRKAESEISALVDGKPFSYDTASGKALEIVEKNFNADTVDARIKIRVELVSVENCSDLKLTSCTASTRRKSGPSSAARRSRAKPRKSRRKRRRGRRGC